MKKIVHLTSADLKKYINEAVHKYLKESTDYDELRDAFENLMNSIDAFEDAYNGCHYDEPEVIDALRKAENVVRDFVTHPEGNGSQKIWDNIGWG